MEPAVLSDRLHRVQRISWVAALSMLLVSILAVGTNSWLLLIVCWAGLLGLSIVLTVAGRRADHSAQRQH